MDDNHKLDTFFEQMNQLNGMEIDRTDKNKINIGYSGDQVFKMLIGDPNIQILPDKLPFFKKLRQFRVSKTNITDFPENFFNEYTELNSIFLNHNKITNFPPSSFENLVIDKLYLNNNPFTELDPSIFRDTKTNYLAISQSQLSYLDETIFDNLDTMISLELDDTLLSELPETIFMNQLHLLGMSMKNTNLITLDADIFLKTNELVNLFLENNSRLKYLPDELFIHTPNLQTLSLPPQVNIPLSIVETKVVRMSSRREFDRQKYRAKWQLQQAPDKLIKILQQIEQDIPVSLDRLAELAKADKEIAEEIIRRLVRTNPDLGRYLPLEQVFIKKSHINDQQVAKLFPVSSKKSRESLQKCSNCGDTQSVMIRKCTNCKADLPFCNVCKRGFAISDIRVTCYHCEHEFHRPHLIAYIQAKGECPVCRKKLVQSKYD